MDQSKTTPKFKVDDIIIANGKKYHIYKEPSWNIQHNCYDYPVDYGLGCTSEAFILEPSIRLATEADSLIAL